MKELRSGRNAGRMEGNGTGQKTKEKEQKCWILERTEKKGRGGWSRNVFEVLSKFISEVAEREREQAG